MRTCKKIYEDEKIPSSRVPTVSALELAMEASNGSFVPQERGARLCFFPAAADARAEVELLFVEDMLNL